MKGSSRSKGQFDSSHDSEKKAKARLKQLRVGLRGAIHRKWICWIEPTTATDPVNQKHKQPGDRRH